MRLMAEVTRHVGGLADAKSVAAGRTGDPSPATALGVFIGLQAAVRHKFDRDALKGLRVAIQGVGNVGYRIAQHLHAAGAPLWVTDTYAPAVQPTVKDFGATTATNEAIQAAHVHSFLDGLGSSRAQLW